MTRAVLDANVLIAALVNPQGSPAACLRAHAEGRFDLIVSPRLVSELARVLRRRRLRPFVTTDQADRLVEALTRDAVLVEDPRDPAHVSRGDGDDYLVALGRAASAHVLVTGDADLLELELPDLAIVSPTDFLRRLPE